MNRLEQGPQAQEQQFRNAVQLAMHILHTRITASGDDVIARTCFHRATKLRIGEVLVLPAYVPWKHEVMHHEAFADIQFVMHPHAEFGWVTAAVPLDETARRFCCAFPPTWLGKEAPDLAMATGVPTARFCHANGFMAVTANTEDAIAIARMALHRRQT